MFNKIGLLMTATALIVLLGCTSGDVMGKSVCKPNENLDKINNLFDTTWELYKVKFHKTYESEEEETKRKAIFLDDLKEATDHNRKYYAGESTFLMGVNQFFDIDADEFQNSHFGFGTTGASRPRQRKPDSGADRGNDDQDLDNEAIFAV